ncbi:LOW QUALITY PROTEIN: UDP-glucuronosyltransferase 1A6-like [Spheniscus humboldti]
MRSVLATLSHKEHEIVVVAPEVNLNVKASEYYTLKTYPVPLTREELGASMHSFANDLFERRPFLRRITALYEKIQVISGLYVSSCTSLLHNKDLMQYLEGSKFDAVLTDPVVPCGQILALHLSIPSVFFLRGLPCSFDLQATHCPDPPSYVPRTFTDNSDRMTFIQRVENLFLKSSESFLCNFAYLPFELLASDVLHRPVTMKELLSHGSIWLKRMDFVFEYPMPVMPNIVFIGANKSKDHPKKAQHRLLKKVELGILFLCSTHQISAQMAPVLSAHPQVTAALVLLLSMLSLAAGGKLLVVPVDGSHWLSMREVLDGLRQKGREIVIIALPEINIHIKPENFIMKMYPIPFTKEEVDGSIHSFSREIFEEGSFLERFLIQRLKSTSAITLSACAHLLYNKELVRYLEESKFDAVFTDPVIPCGQILAEHLSVPSVFFLRGMPCGLDFEATQCPHPPSYVPRIFTDHTDHMNFLQRVKNLILDIPNYFLCDFFFQPYAKLASEFLQRDVTVPDLLRQASIWLMRLDFALDYPRPLMPNIIFIGGVNCAHKKLPQAAVSFHL